MASLVDVALSYAGRGWYVLPLHDVTQGRCSCGNLHCVAPAKHPRIMDWTNAASIDEATIRQWWGQWPHANVGILTGERSHLAVLDVDPRNGGDLALEDLVATYGALPETPMALSGSKGPHYYLALDGPLGKFDPGPGLNLQADGALIVAPPSVHYSGNTYEWEASSHPDDLALAPLPDWLKAMGAAKDNTPVDGVALPDTLPVIRLQDLNVDHRVKFLIQTGEDPDDPGKYSYPNGTPDRSRALFAVIQALLSAGHHDATIASVVMDARYGISAKVLSQKHARNPRYWEQTKAWVAREIARNRAKQPPRLLVGGQMQHGAAEPYTWGSQPTAAVTVSEPWTPPPSLPWPVLDDKAYYGLPGKIVRSIEPHTESDPVALLVQLLVMVGNVIGHTAYFPVEAALHHMNLFAAMVGATSRSRKGTSAAHSRRLLKAIDATWSTLVKGGLSSGEGIIWHVRDEVRGHNKKNEEVCLVEGVDDKRLCILEEEFARALTKKGQEGNILSHVLREAWDHGDLHTLVSGRHKAPVNASNAHISVIGHITLTELQRLLTETDAANGFANRFLWVCVKRSKLLPSGGRYPETELRSLRADLTRAIFFARRVGQMQRSAEAEIRWKTLYTTLAAEHPGLLGAITARAEAQVLRLACLYALLDETRTIDVAHLEAAYALWNYCAASARYIFGTILGHPLSDDIYLILQDADPDGLTRTEISHALGRNTSSAAIQRALRALHEAGMARASVEKTAGRSAERWFLHARGTNELSELSPPPAPPLNSFNSLSPLAVKNASEPDIAPLSSAPIMSPLHIGDLVELRAEDGSQTLGNGLPYPWLIIDIAPGSDGHSYARFMEMPGGWPLAQCQRWEGHDDATEDL